MKFGITFPIGEHDVRDIGKVEELGYDSLWTGEHIFFHIPTPDALTILSAFAALTQRIRLGSAIVLLPLRPPAIIAKQSATVDIISGGRLILGVGVGGEYPKEFEACGVPMNERGARADEALHILRRLWSEDDVTFEGRFSRLPGVTLKPKPVQKGGPPIWVSGRSEGAMKRAGRFGDAYIPYLFSPDRYHRALSRVREHADEAGRDPAGVTPAISQFICVSENHEEAKRQAAAWLRRTFQQPMDDVIDRYVVFGASSACVERLQEFAAAGVQYFVFVPTAFSTQDFYLQAQICSQEIIPAMRKGATRLPASRQD